MSKGELDLRGINDSITHEDFMVGTEDLSIIGITQDGRANSYFCGRQFRVLVCEISVSVNISSSK
jgi:aminopeptidase